MATSADVVIVGSGPLGTAAARRLAEGSREVLILEQGPSITDPPGSHLRNAARIQADPDSYLPNAVEYLEYLDQSVTRGALPGAAVTRVQGGQGVIWTNLCPRGDAPWDALTPAQWDEVYALAQTYLGVQAEGFEASLRQQRIKAALGSALSAKGRAIEPLPVAAQFGAEDRLHFSAPYDTLAGSPATARVRVSQAPVERLAVKGARVTGVIAGGDSIEAEEVIVAAGAIGTPQLLHRSGIRPAALGRWLTYHPILICQLVLDETLCAAPGAPDREPRLQIRPSAAADWYAVVLRDVSPFEPQEPDLDVDSNRLVEIQMICPVDLDPQNGIAFDDQSRPSFHAPLSHADQARLEAAEADAQFIIEALGRTRSGCDAEWMPFGFAHMMGTTRMSAADDGTGVADYSGRVWGIDNLRLATNGLIPTRMAVNPTLTGVALSIWVADGLLRE